MDDFKRNELICDKKGAQLFNYKKKVTSEYGEDGIIEKIFEIIGEGDKWCVDVGAGDGKTGSNTWNLISNKGWSGVLIEANNDNYKKLRETYMNNKKIICVNKIANFEGPDRLDNILSNTPIPESFDLLSIDIDGNDYHLWESLGKYVPKVVIIEFNPTIPDDIEFIQPRNMKISQGSSLLSLTNLGKMKGYELVSATDVNAFFVKKEFFNLFKIQDNSPHSVRKTSKNRETRLYQLYDGTLVLTGCTRLIWHGIDIDQKKIQVLPKFIRRYPGELKHSWAMRLFFEFYQNESLKTVLFGKIKSLFKRIASLI